MSLFKFVIKDGSFGVVFQKIIESAGIFFGTADEFSSDITSGGFSEFRHIQTEQFFFFRSVKIVDHFADDFCFACTGRSEKEKHRGTAGIADSHKPVPEFFRNSVNDVILTDDTAFEIGFETIKELHGFFGGFEHDFTSFLVWIDFHFT